MTRAISALTTILLLTAPAMSTAQSAEDDWAMNCDGKRCAISRQLNRAEDGKRIATFFALKPVGVDEIRVGVALPLGVALGPGIRFAANDTQYDIPMEVCFPDGCRAQRAFTADELEALSGAETVSIQFFAYGQQQPMALSMPATGLSTALTDLRAKP